MVTCAKFQSDRLSIDLAFKFNRVPLDLNHKPAFSRLVATLLNEPDESIDREEFVLYYLVPEDRHIFYLVYPNPHEEHLFYSVPFDTLLTTLSSVQFYSTEISRIPFGFLPVN